LKDAFGGVMSLENMTCRRIRVHSVSNFTYDFRSSQVSVHCMGIFVRQVSADSICGGRITRMFNAKIIRPAILCYTVLDQEFRLKKCGKHTQGVQTKQYPNL